MKDFGLFNRGFVLVIFFSTIIFPQNFWNPSKGLSGDRISSVTSDKNGNLFAVSINNGFYKSTDNGNTWVNHVPKITNLTENDYVNSVFDINFLSQVCVQPSGKVFYSMDGSLYMKGKFCAGIFRVESDGNVSLINNGIGSDAIFSLATDKYGNLYAGTASGLYKSTDNGDNWNFIGFDKKIIRCISISNYGEIYVGADFDGIYVSNDNGKSWNHFILPASFYYSILTDNQNNIYVAMHHALSIYESGVCRSTDRGMTWQMVNNNLDNLAVNSLILDNEGNILVGSGNGSVYRSTNHGDSWSRITNLPISAGITSLIKTPNGNIFAATDGIGIINSTDNGTTWQIRNSGFHNSQVESMTILPNGDLLSGTLDSGIYKLNKGTTAWIPSSKGFLGSTISSFAINNDGDILAASANGIYASKDNGNNWFPVTPPDGGAFYSLLKLSGNTILASGFIGGNPPSELYISTNGGYNWYQSNYDLPSVGYLFKDSKGNIFASSMNDTFGIYKSSDNGSSWTKKCNDLTDLTSFLELSPNLYLAAALSGRIYKSTDQGETWSSTLLSGNTLNTIFKTSNGDLFVGTFSNGVLRSTDNGSTWNKYNDGLTTNRVITSLATPDNKIFLGTDNGIFQDDYVTGVKQENEAVTSFNLSQNYPNPFNPSTIINYQLPKSGYVQIKVYDELGREVAALVNEVKSAGNYSVTFNANNLSSGIYIYQLSTGNFISIKKMILLK